ncbi:MAG: DUF2442 domain-containing protein [Desulfamplus sp.]|nr:DUF2442 domain-containing protein [Desulfamplus sp.]
MGLSIKVKKVEPLDNMILLIEFENRVIKKYDVKTLIPQFPIFKRLEDKSLFNLVHVDCCGYSVAWNDEIDISEYELWEGGFPS